MKVLFVPLPEGGAAHLIPLLALNKMLAGTSVETAFLVPGSMHTFLRQFGVNVLDIDNQLFIHNGLRSEMRAYRKFPPDVVVDDANPSTGFATALAHLTRVAIHRTGMFPGGEPRNKNHRHSMAVSELTNLPDVTFLGLEQPQTFTDFFKAQMKIVPGIKSIEVLPSHLLDDSSYVFAGPLLLEDYMMGEVGLAHLKDLDGSLHLDSFMNFEPLQKFFYANRHRRIAYATFGTHANASAPMLDALKYLLDKETAVVSSLRIENLSASQSELYYYANYLPMHFVCSNVDIMIHQCGSGTYHYPIMHNLPTITIGTGCHDREDVAMRLEELGVSKHLPGPEERADFYETFKETIKRLFDDPAGLLPRREENLAALNLEIKETMAAFNFEEVLHTALARHQSKLR
jgi:UDP:flavonoid glycosyltransferase YjiC (YdhE family)